MPSLNLFTNVPVDAVIASDILKDATKVVSKIIGKPESVKSPSFFSFSSLYLVWTSLVRPKNKKKNSYTHTSGLDFAYLISLYIPYSSSSSSSVCDDFD